MEKKTFLNTWKDIPAANEIQHTIEGVECTSDGISTKMTQNNVSSMILFCLRMILKTCRRSRWLRGRLRARTWSTRAWSWRTASGAWWRSSSVPATPPSHSPSSPGSWRSLQLSSLSTMLSSTIKNWKKNSAPFSLPFHHELLGPLTLNYLC